MIDLWLSSLIIQAVFGLGFISEVVPFILIFDFTEIRVGLAEVGKIGTAGEKRNVVFARGDPPDSQLSAGIFEDLHLLSRRIFQDVS
jgi:hypothetical protein